MRTLLLSFALLCLASLAFAQQGSVGIFKDTYGMDCNLDDKVQGLGQYHVVHVLTTGSTAVRYMAKKPTCMTASYLADTNYFGVTIGNSQTGVSVGYGSCRVGPILVQTLQFFTMGTTPACCRYVIEPDPLAPSGQIETVDCAFEPNFATGGQGIVNALPSCTCDVPVEETTWGGVKALYGE